ncbi:MAG: hypothetical protein JWO62_2236 [Acidimicrobiaceae bacterium]|nr:hypothetical protein [Acidimicrobiaceae bacterium]
MDYWGSGREELTVTEPLTEIVAGVRALVLRNDHLAMSLLVDKGCDIYSLIDVASGVDVLFKSPWGLRPAAAWTQGQRSIDRFIAAYPGGWQLLLPNGGDECSVDGAIWPYHGEAAMMPWSIVSLDAQGATLETRLVSVPFHIRREFHLDGPTVRLRESVTNESADEIEVMWSHHPAFGAPFLEARCVFTAGSTTLLADDLAPGTHLKAGSRHSWPVVRDTRGESLDLSVMPGPDDPRAVLAYLEEFETGFFSITNPRLGLGVALRWPIETFPKAWLWQEVHASTGWPWYRRAYVAAIEPASTIPGQGFESARRKGQSGVRFAANETKEIVIEATLFTSRAAVVGMDEGGSVRFAKSQHDGRHQPDS